MLGPNPAPSNIPDSTINATFDRISGGSDERLARLGVRKCIRKNGASIGPSDRIDLSKTPYYRRAVPIPSSMGRWRIPHP